MKKRLSAFGYIRNNKRTCSVLVIALALTFMAMYVVGFILSTTTESVRPVIFEYPRRITFAELTMDSFIPDRSIYADTKECVRAYKEKYRQFFEDLENDPDVEKVYDTQFLIASYNGVIGGIGYDFPLLAPEEVPVVAEHMGAELIEGRMPEGDGELLIDEKVMKNAGMKVGDWYRKDNYGEVFKVVGVLRSEGMACIGTPRGNYNNGWGFVILCNDNSCDFFALAEKYGVHPSEENGDNISDIVTYREMWEDDIESVIDNVNNVIILVVMVFLSISMIVAYVSFMRNRMNEYCLYASIGYSRGEIYGMIMREMAILFMTGLVMGALSSLGIMKLLEMIIITPRGLTPKWFMGGHLLGILGAFAVIVGILQIPVMVSIYRIRTIDMIED